MARVTYSPCPSCRSKGKDSRGDNLVNYPDGGAHCFSCGYHQHPPAASRYLPKEKHHGSKVLPSDWTREVPTEGWKWLLQYGLPYSYWKDRVGWSPASSRLVIKVGSEADPAFTIGRFIRSGDTHVSSDGGFSVDRISAPPKWFVWGDCHSHAERLGQLSRCSVLVEDIISAHKVAQVEETIPLFGTVPHPTHLYALRGSEKPVVLWLDQDQAGASQKRALRLQMQVNRPVVVVHTRLDPKSLSIDEIKQELNNG